MKTPIQKNLRHDPHADTGFLSPNKPVHILGVLIDCVKVTNQFLGRPSLVFLKVVLMGLLIVLLL